MWFGWTISAYMPSLRVQRCSGLPGFALPSLISSSVTKRIGSIDGRSPVPRMSPERSRPTKGRASVWVAATRWRASVELMLARPSNVGSKSAWLVGMSASRRPP